MSLLHRSHPLTAQALSDDDATAARRDRLVECQKQSLELVVAGAPLEGEDGILHALARSMESQLDGAVVAIHLMEPDGFHFGFVAAPSLPPDYARATRGMDARFELGCCSSAVVSHTPTIVRDFAAEKRWPSFTPKALALGLRGCFTTPILSRERRVLGTFAIYYRQARDPSPHDRDLVEVVTSTVAMAIERRQAEEALRQSEQRYRQLADLLPAAVYTCDATGLITYYNRQAVALWGREPRPGDTDERFCGSEQMVLDDGRTLPHDECPMAVALRDGSSFREQPVNVRRPDGSMVSVRVNIDPIRDAAGRIVGAVNVFHDVTEVRRAEDALRESEERFRAFISATSDAVYRMSPDWTEMRQLQGREFIADTPDPDRSWLQKYIHPDDQPLVMETIRRAIETTSVFELEHRVIRVDGSLGWTHSRAIPILSPGGEIIEWFGAARDVTRRRQAEEVLRASHTTFRQLVENSPFGLYVVDADFRLSMVSAGAQKVFKNVRPLIGRDFAEVLRVIWPEPAASGFIELFRRTLATGEPYHSPSTVERRADIGETEAYDWKIERIATPDGRHGVVCHFYDWSDRQRLEAALRESEARFRMLADNMAQLAWTCDQLGNVTWYNKRWLDYTGLTFEEMKDWGWKQCHHPDHVDRVVASVTRSRDSGEIWEDTFPLRGKDGRYRWFLSRAYPIRDEQGTIVRWFGTNTDITDERQAEEALRDKSAALERVNQELDRFVAIASHDLKEPLRGMATLSSFVLDDEPGVGEESRARLTRIIELAQRLTGMLDSLLDYARVGGQREREPCDLEVMARRAADKLREMLEARSVAISITGPMPVIEGDAAMLERMFANLIGNAVKHNPADDRRVEIGCEEGGAVFVRDNGPGIDPRHHDDIFQLFRRLPQSRSSSGTGVGLALVRNIVLTHGGAISVRSAPGEGTTFLIRFPPAASPAGDKPLPSHAVGR